MEIFEKKSKGIFIATLIAYIAFKLYVTISSMDELLKEVPGSSSGELDMVKYISIASSVVGTAVFVAATYFIYRAVYRNINKDNQEMLERFSGIYFANMTMLYIGSIGALVLSAYVFKNQILLPTMIGIVIKLFLILGVNFILIDGEDSKIGANMASLGVLSLF